MIALLLALRPKQWLKNAFVIAPIFFAQKFSSYEAWSLTLLASLAFGFAASAVYIINDIFDQEEDKKHPVKSKRPLAAGLITVKQSILLSACCLFISLLLLFMLPADCARLIAIYVIANLFYTLVLKNQALLDVFFIGFCFILRVLVGCYAISVMVSPWIILTTFMLSLFLAFGKRYNELGIENYAGSRINLRLYNRELLDKLVIICAAAALICYAIYAAEMASLAGNLQIIYSVAFVAFGLFRYLQFIYVFKKGGEPEEIILQDKLQWINISLWLICIIWPL